MTEEKIKFSDWEKCDIRVGTILKADDHPKADKLYILKVDFGALGERTIVAGLKNHYKRIDLLDKQGIFIVNLEPATIRGIKSDGMTLAAVNNDESLICILSPEKHIEPGSKIR